MQVKIIKRYKDLELNKILEPGTGEDVVMKMSKERAEELIDKGFVEEVKVEPTKKEGTK